MEPTETGSRMGHELIGAVVGDGAVGLCGVNAGGPAPARAYIEELMPDVLEGRIEPGRVFDWVGKLENVLDGYRAMNDRSVIKALIEF
jgi:hypothetical protein